MYLYNIHITYIFIMYEQAFEGFPLWRALAKESK